MGVLCFCGYILLHTDKAQIHKLMNAHVGNPWLNLFFKYIYNDFVDLSLKGEYMIIKNADKKNLLVPINNVNKCKSTRFFNLMITSFEFNLDGIKRKVYFVATNEKISTFHSHRNKEILRVA
jgi:hypothetical protein